MKALFWCAQLLLTSSVALLTHASKVDGGYAYNTYSVPFFSELLKLCISAILLAIDYKHKPRETLCWSWHMILASLVPAAAYFVSNNVNFFVVQYLGPSTFQLLSSLKIVSTAVFFRVVMGVQLSGTKWKMLVLITLGCAVSQLGSSNMSLSGSSNGYALKFLNVVITGFASVYNEKVLKSSQTVSVHYQNLILYLWGVLFALCSLFSSSPYVFRNPKETIKGYTCDDLALS
ncbi:nucleotide-sugar transporter [Pseudoscourfieldia marina]